MKEITKERTHVEKYTVYEAFDGTEFTDHEECIKYEGSALCVVRSKVSKLIAYDTRSTQKEDAWTIMGGVDDHNIVAIRMNSVEDLDIVKQWFLLENPYSWEFKAQKLAIMDTAFNTRDILIFGINCEGEYYFINSRHNIIDNLMRLDKKVDKDE